MLRTMTALAAFGLLALVFAIGVSGGNSAVSGMMASEKYGMPMMNANNGQPVTLEMIQKDIYWRQATAQKLRELE